MNISNKWQRVLVPDLHVWEEVKWGRLFIISTTFTVRQSVPRCSPSASSPLPTTSQHLTTCRIKLSLYVAVRAWVAVFAHLESSSAGSQPFDECRPGLFQKQSDRMCGSLHVSMNWAFPSLTRLQQSDEWALIRLQMWGFHLWPGVSDPVLGTSFSFHRYFVLLDRCYASVNPQPSNSTFFNLFVS